MTRRQFTRNLAQLIFYAYDLGYEVFVDYVMRSASEQNHFYIQEKSKCDGYYKISNHQKGLAVDLYIWDLINNKIDEDYEKYKKLHVFWESLGGKPMIGWDLGHFEG